jgi:hypothetical protein
VPLYYLDANPLMRWAEGQAETATGDQLAAAARVEAIINDGGSKALLSEYTFLEFYDNILKYQAVDASTWSAEWVRTVQLQLMSWIGAGRLEVLPPALRAVDVATSYISLARKNERALRAMDAVHFGLAIETARESKTQVVLVTADKAFERFLEIVPAARTFITIEEISVTQAPVL